MSSFYTSALPPPRIYDGDSHSASSNQQQEPPPPPSPQPTSSSPLAAASRSGGVASNNNNLHGSLDGNTSNTVSPHHQQQQQQQALTSSQIHPSFHQEPTARFDGASNDDDEESGFKSDSHIQPTARRGTTTTTTTTSSSSPDGNQHHQILNGSDNSGIPPVGMLSRNGRVLSSTKRAAQNREAQRNFRKRKESYIRDLEDRAKELSLAKQTIEALRVENFQLRDYILALQSRLIEQPGGVPTPPAVYAKRPHHEFFHDSSLDNQDPVSLKRSAPSTHSTMATTAASQQANVPSQQPPSDHE